MIVLLQEVGVALGPQHFVAWVGDLCPYLLDVVENDASADRTLTMAALSCVRGVCASLAGHIHVSNHRVCLPFASASALKPKISLIKFYFSNSKASCAYKLCLLRAAEKKILLVAYHLE